MTTAVLITGATDGIGRDLALRLAADGTRLLLHGRNPDKLADVAAAALSAGAPDAPTFRADLASLDQVRGLAESIQQGTDRLDVLVNNAGVGFGTERAESTDGYELRLAVNHLAGFLLTLELMPLLRASAPARVVNVASAAQSRLDLDDIHLADGPYDGPEAYSRSKLAQVMATIEWSQRVPADEVTFTSVHPATFMPTNIVLEVGITPVDTVESGVDSVYRLVNDPALQGPSVSGTYYNRLQVGRTHPDAEDAETRRRVWRRSLDLVGHDDVPPLD